MRNDLGVISLIQFHQMVLFPVLNANIQSTVKRNSKEIQLPPNKLGGNKYGYLKEIHTKHKIKRQKLECDQPIGMCLCPIRRKLYRIRV